MNVWKLVKNKLLNFFFKKRIFYPANILDFSLLWLQRPAPVGSVVTWTYKQENLNNTDPFSQTHNQYSTKKIIKLTYL